MGLRTDLKAEVIRKNLRIADLEKRNAELKLIADEYQRLMYHMDAGGDFFEFQRDQGAP